MLIILSKLCMVTDGKWTYINHFVCKEVSSHNVIQLKLTNK